MSAYYKRWRAMCVLPQPPSVMLGGEYRRHAARRHTGRQRCYNLPELLEIVPEPGKSEVGQAVIRLVFRCYFSRHHALRVVSIKILAVLLTAFS